MSQSVDRLKQLLFDNEAQALDELARRIDGVAETETRSRDVLNQRIESVATADTRGREALAQRIESVADVSAKARDEIKRTLDEVYARTGSTERMTASVTEVINEALRRAEVSKHSELTQTIAPLVVTTIKTELRNSQDEMVEALYPITGRLVKAYVASAMKDLSDQMNRRLEQNPVMLRLQSLTTGRSVGELALAGTQNFDVKELYLIRRGSGELVARWPEGDTSGRDQAMSGVLAAVNEFANEAFSADQSSLRQIDLGDEEVYLRGSPIYLLAARCSGRAAKSIEQTLDNAFLSAVETQHSIDSQPGSSADSHKAKTAALARVGENLKTEVASQIEELHRPGGTGVLKALAAAILLPLIGWWAWSWYTDYRIADIKSVAHRIIEVDPAMQGYPAEIDVANRGRTLTVSGLTPSQQAKTRIVNDLSRNLPGVQVQDRLSVVAGSGITVPDVSPELAKLRQDMADASGEAARISLSRSFVRAESRLRQAEVDLSRASAVATDKAQGDALKRNASEASAILADAKLLTPLQDKNQTAAKDGKAASAFQALAGRLQTLGDELVLAGGGEVRGAAASKTAKPAASDGKALDVTIEQFAADAERVSALASTVAFAKAMRPVAAAAIAAPAPQVSPRQRLQDWVQSHAIFFAANLDYRNSDSAKRYIAELAQLMKGAAPSLVRIVGYTDEAGGQARNSALAQDRAFKIRGELIGLGVPVAQITAVGRTGANELSDARGPESPNRRVEFELGFDGENQP
jgi:outer membrane protein OmpA-like peptidoglycan-associated protein